MAMKVGELTMILEAELLAKLAGEEVIEADLADLVEALDGTGTIADQIAEMCDVERVHDEIRRNIEALDRWIGSHSDRDEVERSRKLEHPRLRLSR